MFKTIIGIAVAGFVLKRTSPKTYSQVVTALDDAVTIVSDVTTAARGQVSAYTAEACKDAAERLKAVDPNAVASLRTMLDGGTQQVQPAQHGAARRVRP